MRILTISENPKFNNFIRENFEEKCIVYSAIDLEEALIALVQDNIELAIIDCNKDFENLALKIMKKISTNPHIYSQPENLIILGDKYNDNEAETAYSINCSDFIRKPIEDNELILKLKKIEEKHQREHQNETLLYNGIHVNQKEHLVYFNNKLVDLKPKEYDVLCFFLEKQGRTFSRKQAYNLLWNEDYFDNSGKRKLDNYIYRLKKKIDILQTLLISKKNIGYMLKKDNLHFNTPNDDNNLEKKAVVAFLEIQKNDNSNSFEFIEELSPVIISDIINNQGKILKIVGNIIIFMFDKDFNYDKLHTLIIKLISRKNSHNLNLKLAIDYSSISYIETGTSLEVVGDYLINCPKILKLADVNDIISSKNFFDQINDSKNWSSIGFYNFDKLKLVELFQFEKKEPKVSQIIFKPITHSFHATLNKSQNEKYYWTIIEETKYISMINISINEKISIPYNNFINHFSGHYRCSINDIRIDCLKNDKNTKVNDLSIQSLGLFREFEFKFNANINSGDFITIETKIVSDEFDYDVLEKFKSSKKENYHFSHGYCPSSYFDNGFKITISYPNDIINNLDFDSFAIDNFNQITPPYNFKTNSENSKLYFKTYDSHTDVSLVVNTNQINAMYGILSSLKKTK